jgi:hypothetical protein
MNETSMCFINWQKALFQNTKVNQKWWVMGSNYWLFGIVESFGLQGPESYLYTSRSNCLDVEGIDDVNDFQDTLVSGSRRLGNSGLNLLFLL